MITLGELVGSTNGALIADQNFLNLAQAIEGATVFIASPSTHWYISHNLGYIPASISVVISDEMVFCKIKHIDENACEIFFNSPMSGFVRCQ